MLAALRLRCLWVGLAVACLQAPADIKAASANVAAAIRWHPTCQVPNLALPPYLPLANDAPETPPSVRRPPANCRPARHTAQHVRKNGWRKRHVLQYNRQRQAAHSEPTDIGAETRLYTLMAIMLVAAGVGLAVLAVVFAQNAASWWVWLAVLLSGAASLAAFVISASLLGLVFYLGTEAPIL